MNGARGAGPYRLRPVALASEIKVTLSWSEDPAVTAKNGSKLFPLNAIQMDFSGRGPDSAV